MPDRPPVNMLRYVLVLGFALFAMFFGAGNLIFPPTLGRLAGDQFVYSIFGFLLTGVGLPLMGILAVAKAEGGIDHIASRVDSRIAKVLSVVIMLAIGPLLAIPRTCATTFELGIMPNISWMGSWLFSFIFFGIVLLFALNPLAVVDRIGKILTPVLLLALLALIVKGIIKPIAPPITTGEAHSFGQSLIEGYQTMDLMAATIFGIIILSALRSKGVFDKGKQLSAIVKAGIVSASGLAIIYGGLVYLGATSSVMTQDVTRTQLVLNIANQLMGSTGVVVLAVAVSMACLTTAIGLTVVCGQYFNKLSYGGLNYKWVCISVTAVSFVLSNAGVEMIIKVAVPLLVALYPTVMVLVILTLIGDKLGKRSIWRGAVAGAFTFGLIEAAHRTGIEAQSVNAIFDILPLTHHGLGWLLPAAVLGGMGALIRERKLPSFRVLAVCPSQLFTKVAIFDDRVPVFETAIPHKLDHTMTAQEISSQFSVIKAEVEKRLGAEKINLSTVDAVAARGGFLRPLPGGTYRINETMLDDLEKNAWRQHPSNWGASIAHEIATANKLDAYIVDPIVVDEMDDVAKISGIPGVKRSSIFHASNHKSVARRVAKILWKRYDQVNVIVAHIGDGTSVGAHCHGKVIDVNNALDGDGPFSVLSAGSIPSVDVVKMCFEEGAKQEDVLYRIRNQGGLLAYLGTTNMVDIKMMVRNKDEKAVKLIETMGYQVAKEIGGLAAALNGRVDAIALTGELADCPRLVNYIKSKVRFLAPVFIFPGESETTALVNGTLRILREEEGVQEYD